MKILRSQEISLSPDEIDISSNWHIKNASGTDQESIKQNQHNPFY